MVGIEDYGTSEEIEFQIEFDFKYAKQAFNDNNITKEYLLNKYIADDTQFMMDWLISNKKDFKKMKF